MEIDGGHELTRTALRLSGISASALPSAGAMESGSAAVAQQEQKLSDDKLNNWYSMICAPTNIRDDDQVAPDAKLDLEVRNSFTKLLF